MDFKEAFENLKQNPELRKPLAEAIERNADASELNELMVKAGVAAEDVDALVSEYQRRRGLAISEEDVEEDVLRKVAGGGSGTSCTCSDDCDDTFKDSSWWGMERCDYNENCDELFC